jgi:hypothetical protein
VTVQSAARKFIDYLQQRFADADGHHHPSGALCAVTIAGTVSWWWIGPLLLGPAGTYAGLIAARYRSLAYGRGARTSSGSPNLITVAPARRTSACAVSTAAA